MLEIVYSFVTRNEWLVRGCIVAKHLKSSRNYHSYFIFWPRIRRWGLQLKLVPWSSWALAWASWYCALNFSPERYAFRYQMCRQSRSMRQTRGHCGLNFQYLEVLGIPLAQNTHVIQNMRCKRQLQIWLWVPQKRDNISSPYIFRKGSEGKG